MLDATVHLTPEARLELSDAIDGLGLSGRGLDRVTRVARTFADLAGSDSIHPEHVGRALQLRAIASEREVVG
jgi:magnesium chelatase family protein